MNKKFKDVYAEMFSQKIIKKIVIVPEKERFYDDFKEPTAFFIINALGDAIYFKTRDRAKAQSLADEMYGKGFYTVKKSMKAAVR